MHQPRHLRLKRVGVGYHHHVMSYGQACVKVPAALSEWSVKDATSCELTGCWVGARLASCQELERKPGSFIRRPKRLGHGWPTGYPMRLFPVYIALQAHSTAPWPCQVMHTHLGG
jgi:hypothetical protein